MTFNEAVDRIMPLVSTGDTTTPFVISRQDGEWVVNHPYPSEKLIDFLEDVRDIDSLAVAFTGADFSKGSFSYVYDRILNERLRAEYDNIKHDGLDAAELYAIMNMLEENIGEFSSEATDYLTSCDEPLTALYNMSPISLKSDEPDYEYDYDKIGNFVNAIENEINRLKNLEKQDITVEPEKRIIEGYEEKLSLQIAGKFIVLAENPKAAEPYIVCNIKSDNPLNMEERYDGIATDNYVEALRELVNRADSLVSELEAEQRDSGLTLKTLTSDDCTPNSKHDDFEGKLVIIKAEILAPEYRSSQHQLALATGGFGCNPTSRGRAVYVKELYSGKECRYDRHQIAGIADPKKIPNWAIDKLLEYHKKETQQNSPDKKPATLQEKLGKAKDKVREDNAKKSENPDKTKKKRDTRE